MVAISAIRAPRNRLNLSAEGPSDAQHLWTVTCTPNTNEFDIVTFRKLPQMGQPHPKNRFMQVANYQADQRSPILWHVLVQYALPTSDIEAGSNPLLMPPVVNFDVEKWEEEIFEDIESTPFTTVLGEPFANLGPVFRRFSDRIAVIEKNVPYFNQWDWEETVNTDWFMGAPPGHALLEEVTAAYNKENNVPYYRRVAKVHFRRKGWRIRRLHAGLKYKVRGQDGIVREVMSKDGPVLLNKNGFKVPWPSKVAKPPFFSDASYLEWDIYRRGSLNRLRLFG